MQRVKEGTGEGRVGDDSLKREIKGSNSVKILSSLRFNDDSASARSLFFSFFIF